MATQKSNSWFILAFARAPPHFYVCLIIYFQCYELTVRMQPGIMILPYIDGDQAAAEATLEPFRTKVTPVFAQTGFAPDYNAVSHGADAMLTHVPPRAVVGGASFSQLWDDVIGWVFGEWVQFTEADETKQTMIMFEFGKKGKIDSVAAADTAFPLRDPHYYTIITAR